MLARALDVEALVKAVDRGIDLLPGGRASISIGPPTEIDGPGSRAVGLLVAVLPPWRMTASAVAFGSQTDGRTRRLACET
jgi:hypothetical protein